MKIEIVLATLMTISLLRIAVSSRIETYIKMLSFQGFLLFGLIFCAEEGEEAGNILAISLAIFETIIIKALLVPIYLQRVISANHIKLEEKSYVPTLFSLIAVIFCIIVGSVTSFYIKQELPEINAPYFSLGVGAILSGFFIILSRKKLITHVIGYCILENGIFLLTLAMMSKFPYIVSLGVALDAFIWVLLAGILVKLIRIEFRTQSIDNLKGLKH